MAGLTNEQKLEALELAARRRKFEAWRYYKPMAKHREFFAAGAAIPERMLCAGNGNGKTWAAAYEVSRHLTGEYPSWWDGYRYDKPILCWGAGESGLQVRDGIQKVLCGEVGAIGTGMLPRDAFEGKPAMGRSAPDGYESVSVKHKSGVSRLVFKTYEQQREYWQGPTIDLAWFDEEPPPEIYTEGMTRLRGRGRALLTFTPLKGRTDMVKRFFDEQHPLRALIRMTLDDTDWYTEEQKAAQLAAYPEHEREARRNGTPLLGEGKVYQAPRSQLEMTPVPFWQIPLDWAKIWGVDFGIAHEFGGVLLAWDRDRDVVYVIATVKLKGQTAAQHALAMSQIASNVPVAWPHDGNNRDKGSGEPLAKIYRAAGLSMLDTHATHLTGGYAVEAGIMALDERMRSDRFKVFRDQYSWFEEYGTYHRKNGLIVKTDDHLLDATRIGHMMLRRARAVPLGSSRSRRSGNTIKNHGHYDRNIFG